MRARKTLELLAGLGYLVLVAALISVSIMAYHKDFSDLVRVSLVTGDIGNSLQQGSDVEVRGVPVGTVTGVSTSGKGARIALELDASKAKQLPADITAELLPKTLFGERYVSLSLPVTATGPSLKSGDVIHEDTSAGAVEVQQIFDRLLPVLQAVQPEKLASVLGEIAAALRDRGTELGSTITTIADYLRKFAPKVPTLTADLDKLASVASTYNTAAPSLLHALNDLTVTSRTIVAERQQLTDLFRTVTSSSNTVTGFVSSNSSTIITLAHDSLPSLRVLARYSPEFPCVTKALTDFIPVANKALGVGTKQPGLHVILNVVPSRGAYHAGADTPSFTTTKAPSCPTGYSFGVTTSAARTSTANTGTARTTAGATNSPNSPQENSLISELIAPTMGMSPDAFPTWSSLLLGPTLRGTVVSVR